MPARGAIVPHAPLLLEHVAPGSSRAVAGLRAAVAALDLEGLETIVLLSPHGAESGVYARASGSLDGFGVPGIEACRETDASLLESLSGRWGRPLLETGWDHGIVVPLALGIGTDTRVVAITFAETTGPDAVSFEGVLDDAADLAAILAPLAAEEGLGIVASVNTSAALSARAPMTERAEAQAIESELLSALESDVGAALPLLSRLQRDGRSCACGPLAVLARLFAGSPAHTLAYDAPFGVGYLVARVA